MAYTNPTIADFKARFFRDFPYGSTLTTVQDADITIALNDALSTLNQGLFTSQDFYTRCSLLLSAHFLVLNLQASSQGVSGQFGWLTSGKSAGSVSESFAIPQRIMDNPLWAMYTKTRYGAEYLMLILPYLTGVMFSVHGRTHG